MDYSLKVMLAKDENGSLFYIAIYPGVTPRIYSRYTSNALEYISEHFQRNVLGLTFPYVLTWDILDEYTHVGIASKPLDKA